MKKFFQQFEQKFRQIEKKLAALDKELMPLIRDGQQHTQTFKDMEHRRAILWGQTLLFHEIEQMVMDYGTPAMLTGQTLKPLIKANV